eukprot:3938854-Pyramimonas_sp.AAC.1
MKDSLVELRQPELQLLGRLESHAGPGQVPRTLQRHRLRLRRPHLRGVARGVTTRGSPGGISPRGRQGVVREFVVRT